MSTAAPDSPPIPPPLPSERRRPGLNFFAAMLLSNAALYIMLKVTLTLSRAVKPIYMEGDFDLPLVTVQAMALVEGALTYGRLYLGVPPLFFAAGYVVLASHPTMRRLFVAALVATAVLVTAALVLCLTLPLFAKSGPG